MKGGIIYVTNSTKCTAYKVYKIMIKIRKFILLTMGYENLVGLVTGGVSGIGLAIVKEFLGNGMKVMYYFFEIVTSGNDTRHMYVAYILIFCRKYLFSISILRLVIRLLQN